LIGSGDEKTEIRAENAKDDGKTALTKRIFRR
jgi:hypothetical protein